MTLCPKKLQKKPVWRNNAYNTTIKNKKKEKFWNLYFKAFAIGSLWFIDRYLARKQVREVTRRGDLLTLAAKKTKNKHSRKEWTPIQKWFFERIIANLHKIASTDNAYDIALYETLREYGRMAKKEKLPEWRK